MPLLAVFLSHYWKALMLSGLVAAGLLYRAALIAERDGARAKVATLTAQVATLQAGTRALQAAIDHQNTVVTALKARADAEVNTFAANQATALKAGLMAQQQAQQQAHDLAAAPVDANAGCSGAIRWGNVEAAELAAW